MKHVEAGKSGEREKKKRGCKPKANPRKFRYMFRLNSEDHKQLLAMFEQSGKRSISAFIVDCVLNHKPEIVEINKTAVDFVMLLSSFLGQFRMVKNNYNQVFHALIRNFGEQKARQMMKIVEQSTRDFAFGKLNFERLTIQLKEKCLPK
jgi:DNA-binding LacI/PurR family transcriptional regulator